MPPTKPQLSENDRRERMRGCEFLADQGVSPSSINDANRTVDILFFSGIDVPRVDWWTGEKYVLRFAPKGGDFSLLNNGAPVLDNHSSWDGSASQKGKVEKAWQEGTDSKATLRFSKRADVADLWGDIKDGIVTKFSMGVQILREEKIQENGVEVRLAKKWQPFELSVAPIPADWATTTLSAEERGIAVQPRASAQMEEVNMPDKEKDTGTTQTRAEEESTTVTARSIVTEQLKAAEAAGAIAELDRVLQILKTRKVLGLTDEFANKHIREKTDLNQFRKLALEWKGDICEKQLNTQPGHIAMTQDERGYISYGRDEVDTRRELMGAAVFGMMNPKEQKEDRDNPFLRLSIKQIAEESVRLQKGIRGPIPMGDVATMAMQVTADFAAVLENTARKQLLNKYNAAAPTYRIWCKPSTTPDFKSMTRVRLGEAPTFLKVAEGAQITVGLMADQKETYSLATYGRGVSFSRQMLINDDLGAFNDLIGAFGQQAARLENKVVYAILYANAAMADVVPLIDAAHYNTDTGVLGNTAFDSMFGLMGVQKGIDGVTVLNLVPKYLIVPRALESTARAVTTVTGPNLAASSQNWFAGRLEVVADGEMDTNGLGVVKYFMVADPNIAPVIEYCHLEGAEGPQFIRKDNEQGILGIQFYAYLDFAAKAVDWRGIVYSTGA